MRDGSRDKPTSHSASTMRRAEVPFKRAVESCGRAGTHVRGRRRRGHGAALEPTAAPEQGTETPGATRRPATGNLRAPHALRGRLPLVLGAVRTYRLVLLSWVARALPLLGTAWPAITGARPIT